MKREKKKNKIDFKVSNTFIVSFFAFLVVLFLGSIHLIEKNPLILSDDEEYAKWHLMKDSLMGGKFEMDCNFDEIPLSYFQTYDQYNKSVDQRIYVRSENGSIEVVNDIGEEFYYKEHPLNLSFEGLRGVNCKIIGEFNFGGK